MATTEQLYNSLVIAMQAHGLYNRTLVDRTYKVIQEIRDKKSINNIDHFLRVALIIAKMGFTTEVIAVALLHDLQLLSESELIAIKKYIQSTAVFDIIDYYQKLEMILEKIAVTANPLDFINMNETFKIALYIKIADRIDILKNRHTIKSPYSESEQRIDQFLLKMARAEKARYLIDSLENECFRIENFPLYDAISKQYTSLLRTNTRAISQTRKVFNDCLNVQNLFSTENLTPIKYKTITYKFKARQLVSIYRQLSSLGFEPKQIYDIKKYLNKYRIPLFDITLVIDDIDSVIAMDSFLEFYKNILHPSKIRIIGFENVSDKSDTYLLLEDYYYCKYRLFLKSKTNYLKNTYGFGASANIHFRREQMFTKTEKQIEVFDRSNTSHLIDQGATALDFAFYLHSDIGYCAQYAIINNNSVPAPLSTKLKNGDYINIISESQAKKYHAKIEWFEYVNTKKAIKDLINFFKDRQ